MSEYQELIKNYNRIREYIRSFYVYGFRSRMDYKSPRSYDNERRRIESYLSGYMLFRLDDDGKKVFVTIDTSKVLANPFFKSFKTKSYTKNDVNLHFAIIYLLTNKKLSISQICDEIALLYDNNDFCQDTVRNKVIEYLEYGIIEEERVKNSFLYSINNNPDITPLIKQVIFFSENFPLGVIGSYILDQTKQKNNYFVSKNKYLLDAVDSEIILDLLIAIKKKKLIEIEIYNYRKTHTRKIQVIPLKVAITTQSGRNYLICSYLDKRLISKRIDNILSVREINNVNNEYEEALALYESRKAYTYGVYYNMSKKLGKLVVTLSIKDTETLVLERLHKEARFGVISKIAKETYTFTITSYDFDEIRPWLRTFIGYIVNMECTDKDYVKNFYEDIVKMKQLYNGDNYDT